MANTSNPFVNWALSSNVGTIDSTGLYTAPTVVPFQQNITATATSQADATKSAAATITLTPAISTSITPPSGVTVRADTVAEIDLSWNPSTEAGGTVAGYYVFRNGTEVGSTSVTSFADLGLVSGTAYTYTVVAYDTLSFNSAASAPLTANTPSGTAAPGLVAYYNFNDGAGAVLHDLSGNGNNGAITLFGGGAIPWTSAGKWGGALTFDGLHDWVTVPASPSFALTTGMTVEAWVNPTALSSSDGWVPVAVSEVFPNQAYGLFAASPTSPFGPAGTVLTGGGAHFVYGASALPLTSWTHLATTYDGATQSLYVNGVLVSSGPGTGPLTVVSGGLVIAAVNGDIFTGTIDEVRVYNRALSASEIQNDMLQPTVAAPAFSPAGGSYTSAQTVTLSTSTPGASIRYTTDGSTPTETSGNLYGSPFPVSTTTTVNAIAYRGGWADSLVASATYTFPAVEQISTPAISGGPTTGVSGSLYQFTASGAVSSFGHTVQYSFNWGDGSHSGWTPRGVTSSFHTWSSPGTYTVTVQARCTIDTTVVSSVSAGLVVTITGESISTPTAPSGAASASTTGSSGPSYTYSTSGSASSLGHNVQYQFFWGDGSASPWLPVGTTSISHTWVAPGTYTVTAQARCATDTQVLSTTSPGLTVTVTAGETISTPATPSGPAIGAVGTSYSYTTGGSTASSGNPVRYLIDWGDGTTSGWMAQGTVTASHAWRTAGTYSVTAYAADATGLLIQSSPSAGLNVTMQ